LNNRIIIKEANVKKYFILVMAMLMLILVFSGVAFAKSTRAIWIENLPGGFLINNPVTWIDPAAASATAYANTSISTATLILGTTELTLAKGDYTDIITPRNVALKVSFATGAATTTVVGNCVITGTNARGLAAEETITISTTSAAGNVAWRTITSVEWTVTSITGRETANNALLQLGSGTKIGLPNDAVYTADIEKVNEAGSLTTTYTLDLTYDTITFVNAPDGSKDYTVWQKVRLW
jgi:hypothetical protein